MSEDRLNEIVELSDVPMWFAIKACTLSYCFSEVLWGWVQLAPTMDVADWVEAAYLDEYAVI